MNYGPTLPISEEIHAMKYRTDGETFKEAMARVADTLSDNEAHFLEFKDILLNMRFLPAGRVQAAIGSPRVTTPYNCFVSGTIEDSMDSIMDKAAEAAQTMRLGGGIGYDFSRLRPKGSRIKSLDSVSSGPLSFMQVFDAVCGTVRSAGHRRGAQMATLRIDHPDIEEYITAKNNSDNLTNFNMSVLVTDEFMEAMLEDRDFDLRFDGRVYKTVRAKPLWDKLMRSTWDWAEPGVIFIDRVNEKNNLNYCEDISATNPCGEQPLPPYGACLLGSFNLTKYVVTDPALGDKSFDFNQFRRDITATVRAMDNVVDRATYPLPQQEMEAKNKRRMGLGVTGVANCVEIIGHEYGSVGAMFLVERILTVLRDTAYRASISLALEKGPFPLFSSELYGEGKRSFFSTLPEDIRRDIKNYGLRNSHLLSIAPTGTISLTADNVSSGIEPVFSHYYDRTITTFEGQRVERVMDYAYARQVKGKTADQCTPDDHVNMLVLASRFVDSACSKTCNIGANVSWDEFKDVYVKAWRGGASGCTTFRAAGKRFGVLNAAADEEDVVKEPEKDDGFIDEVEGGACYFDPATGIRTCE